MVCLKTRVHQIQHPSLLSRQRPQIVRQKIHLPQRQFDVTLHRYVNLFLRKPSCRNLLSKTALRLG